MVDESKTAVSETSETISEKTSEFANDIDSKGAEIAKKTINKIEEDAD